MKKVNLLLSLAAIGILLNACASKNTIDNSGTNNEYYIETFVLLKNCSEKQNPINMDTDLAFAGSAYSKNDRYETELIVCKFDKDSVLIKQTENIKVAEKFTSEQVEDVRLLRKCEEDKSFYSLNKEMMVCKRNDGFTQVRIYRDLK